MNQCDLYLFSLHHALFQRRSKHLNPVVISYVYFHAKQMIGNEGGGMLQRCV
jgi:hypothetical protein